MTDELLTRMRSASNMSAAIKCLDEGADEIERTQRDLSRYLKTFVHYHVNNGVDDACKQCGLDLRDRIHSFTAVADMIAPQDAMTDELLTRMRSASSLGAAIKCLDEGADEIERLRHDLDRLMDREVGHVQEIERLRDALARIGEWDECPRWLLNIIDAALGGKP